MNRCINKLPISALMSVYDGESVDNLALALDSIHNQSIQIDELVLVLDGVIRKELIDVINSYNSKIDIKIISHEKNQGLGISLDLGLRETKNNLIIRCDSDDYNHPTRFHDLFLMTENADWSVAVYGSSIFEFEGNLENRIAVRKYKSIIKKEIKGLLCRDPVAHPSVLIDKKKIMSVGGYKHLPYFEDTYLWLRILKANFSIINTEKILLSMRVGREFYSRRCGFKYAINELIAFVKFYKEDLITLNQLIGVSLMRICARLLLPRKIIEIFYKISRKLA